MDKLLGLISNIELSIRYLLSGAVVATIWLLSRDDPKEIMDLAEHNQIIAGVAVIVIGATAYTTYRAAFYCAERSLVRCLCKPPPYHDLTTPNRSQGYSFDYTRFMIWRHSGEIFKPSNKEANKRIDDYLFYRWAVVHFMLILGISLMIACIFKDKASYIAQGPKDSVRTCEFLWSMHTKYTLAAFAIAIIAVTIGMFQCWFLFKVEFSLNNMKWMPAHDAVAAKAKELWESEREPEGRSLEHWFKAEEILRWEQAQGRPPEKTDDNSVTQSNAPPGSSG